MKQNVTMAETKDGSYRVAVRTLDRISQYCFRGKSILDLVTKMKHC